ncbi:hypothetical protein D3C74_305220 [compost metagenome]
MRDTRLGVQCHVRGAQEACDPGTELGRDGHEHAVVGELPELLVEASVELEHAGRAAALGRVDHLLHGLAQAGLGLGVPLGLHAHDDELLEQGAQARDLLEVAARERGDARPAVGEAFDEPFLGEAGEGLAHGDVARAEAFGELALDESGPGREVAAEDGLSQLDGHAVGDVQVGHALERHGFSVVFCGPIREVPRRIAVGEPGPAARPRCVVGARSARGAPLCHHRGEGPPDGLPPHYML